MKGDLLSVFQAGRRPSDGEIIYCSYGECWNGVGSDWKCEAIIVREKYTQEAKQSQKLLLSGKGFSIVFKFAVKAQWIGIQTAF